MDVAHEAGIDFFDVANRYGREPGETETIIGGFYRAVCGRLPADKS
jgi:NDP-hexose C3-ketoreductase / dTDP-4-oxo-2-deoxy-alpha-D-pentos-2-ene 2,3-reductase